MSGIDISKKEGASVGTDEMTGLITIRSELLHGQAVHVRLGRSDLGVGLVDDRTEDGEIVWILFGGVTPRRMFLADDPAEFKVLPPC